jgi:glycerol-3-phosphate dehydrogenase (NAD(P)+)
MNGIAEGVTTTRGIFDLATKRGIEMPITAQVHAVLFEGRSALEATTSLMLRPLKDER